MGRVLVVGSINIDFVAYVPKIPVRGETVLGERLEKFFGGKGANQAIASAKVGADTHFYGCVGNDIFGESLKRNLELNNVSSHIREIAGVSSGTALIAVDNTDNIITVVPGANAYLSDADIPESVDGKDILLCQLEIDQKIVREFFRRGRIAGATNIFNPSPFAALEQNILEMVDIVIVNQTELLGLCELMGIQSADKKLEDVLQEIQSRKNFRAIIVTLGSNGVVLADDSTNIKFFKPYKVQVLDTTGAGDCFAGVLSGKLSEGLDLEQAVEYANRAAAISVTRKGASSSPTSEEISSFQF